MRSPFKARNAYSRDTQRELPLDVRLINTTANALFGVACVLGVAMLLMWLVRQPVFNVRAILVEGEVSRNSEPTIRANALPLIQGNYFTLNLAQAQRAFEAVPWVRRAILQRVWPNRLKVQLEEHQPVALWSVEEGSDQLVNSFGEVFQANLGDVEDDNLPVLQGPKGSSLQVLSAYLQLRPLFERLQLQLEYLTLSSRGSWQAEFNTGAEIELGRGSTTELVERAERFIATVSQVITRFDRPLLFADLRHHEGYALRLQGVTTMAPQTTKKKH
jgi:cell division protein FtsQ